MIGALLVEVDILQHVAGRRSSLNARIGIGIVPADGRTQETGDETPVELDRSRAIGGRAVEVIAEVVYFALGLPTDVDTIIARGDGEGGEGDEGGG